MNERKDSKKPKNLTGPTPERLKLEGDWQDAVKNALEADPPDTNGGVTDEEPDDDDGTSQETLP